MSKIEKRYQRITKNGVEWTPWFTIKVVDKSTLEPWQLKSDKLKNEYREIDDIGNINPIKISYSVNNKQTKKGTKK